jgi:TolA-binding protein
MENPYAERNKEKVLGFAEVDGALRDSIIMCYELLEKNDEELKPIIHQLVTKNPENEELQFIRAMNHMNQGNYAKAIEGFAALRSSEDYDTMDQARYYYALISLYLNSKDREAKSIFNVISSDIKSEFQYHAKDLLAYL